MPPDFGGLVGLWSEPAPPRMPHVLIARYGLGAPQEVLNLTPLNVLQLRKMLDDLITTGETNGFITEEHHRQSALLPTSQGLEKIIPRSEVDKIAGSD